jgi:hypothetical protein
MLQPALLSGKSQHGTGELNINDSHALRADQWALRYLGRRESCEVPNPASLASNFVTLRNRENLASHQSRLTMTDIFLTRGAVATSIVALVLGFSSVFSNIELSSGSSSVLKIILVVIFSMALLSLFYGNVVYQLTRIGQLKRHSDDSDNSNLQSFYEDDGSPAVSILVPSYKEQAPVVMQTIMSAALSEYPNRSITLLLDDPPLCVGADLIALSATRELVDELNKIFAAAADRFRIAERDYLKRISSGTVAISRERQVIGTLFDDAATVVEDLGRRYAELSQPAFAHADELFAREVIERLVREHRGTAALLRNGRRGRLAAKDVDSHFGRHPVQQRCVAELCISSPARPILQCFQGWSARWLGREGSNLRMAESKSAEFTSKINEPSEFSP